MQVVALWVAALVALVALAPVSASAGSSRVAVVVSDELEAYRVPADAFLAELGLQPRVFNLHGRAAEAALVVAQLKSDPPEVVFCVGAKAAYAVKNGMPDTEVVYAAVLDPERYGIVGDRVTGVRMDIEPVTFLSQFTGLLPNVRTIGLIRGPGTPDKRMLAIGAATNELGIKLVVRDVEAARSVRRAFGDLTAGGIDALWLPPDRTTLTTTGYRALADEARRRHLPLLVDTANMVEAGGLFTMMPDPEGVGRQAAALVRELLDGGELQAPVPPEKLLVVLNGRTLDAAELPIDPLLLDFVDRLIE